VRTHIRGACWNVGDRSQFSKKELFLTRLDRGLFRLATLDEIVDWRRGRGNEEVVEGERLRGERGTDPGPAGLSTSEEIVSEDALLRTRPAASEWHSEANIQSMLVTALATDGWSIVSVANTATKEHGIDVIASRLGRRSASK